MTKPRNAHGSRKRNTGYGLSRESVVAIQEAMEHAAYSYVSGTTHGFYHYPARFSPTIARTIIARFSSPGDWVLDPFLGGGTSLIEGLTLGRRVLGVDINSLACFVSRVRTTPISKAQGMRLVEWAGRAVDPDNNSFFVPPERLVKNLPKSATNFFAEALRTSQVLETQVERTFARGVLLKLGQWALDCRRRAPSRRALAAKLFDLATAMVAGMDDFVAQCRKAGVGKRDIQVNRRIACRSAVGLEHDSRLKAAEKKPRLVFTSPPYPGVHVVYHRWQYMGRRETAAPYWIASQRDGRYESFYTGGSRTPTGEANYFAMIESAFRSIRQIIHPEGHVVQLVGFAEPTTHLPRYLSAMRAAGYAEAVVPGPASRLGRRVPNRKWYANMHGQTGAASEVLLIHRPN